jgi:hypothetical protein
VDGSNQSASVSPDETAIRLELEQSAGSTSGGSVAGETDQTPLANGREQVVRTEPTQVSGGSPRRRQLKAITTGVLDLTDRAEKELHYLWTPVVDVEIMLRQRLTQRAIEALRTAAILLAEAAK